MFDGPLFLKIESKKGRYMQSEMLTNDELREDKIQNIHEMQQTYYSQEIK